MSVGFESLYQMMANKAASPGNDNAFQFFHNFLGSLIY
jgi:hypothetical protein